jgi:UDP-GlcNAc:undecaprenyl-phosphate GlcNAc-1-phosphate transferase
VGFLDDDPLKEGRVIHGLRVYGGNGALLKICRQNRVDEVVISSTSFSEERIRQIRHDCAQARIGVKRLRLQIEPLEV